MATKKAKKRAKGRPDHTDIAYQGIKKMLFENEILPGQLNTQTLASKAGFSF